MKFSKFKQLDPEFKPDPPNETPFGIGYTESVIWGVPSDGSGYGRNTRCYNGYCSDNGSSHGCGHSYGAGCGSPDGEGRGKGAAGGQSTSGGKGEDLP
jgi:hypothetical protein